MDEQEGLMYQTYMKDEEDAKWGMWGKSEEQRHGNISITKHTEALSAIDRYMAE